MYQLISAIEFDFQQNANPNIARGQNAYMRNLFDHFGIKANTRQEIQKPYLIKAALPPKAELEYVVKALWEKPQREFQHFAQELTFKYLKQFQIDDIELLEFMITHKSWWDTVDYIAVKLAGHYFKVYKQQRGVTTKNWLNSNNMWLQRSSLLFQLKYKQELDTDLLTETIQFLQGSQEFFINKAIGWVLREYSKTNPGWVLEFVHNHEISKLSKREALRLITNS